VQSGGGKISTSELSQQFGEAEGSLTQEALGKAGAALTTTEWIGTARRSGPASKTERVGETDWSQGRHRTAPRRLDPTSRRSTRRWRPI
jgi:hypothetical protein